MPASCGKERRIDHVVISRADNGFKMAFSYECSSEYEVLTAVDMADVCRILRIPTELPKESLA